MERERYKHGAHTVLELQYHFVWKTKYSYSVLQGDIALRARDPGNFKVWDEQDLSSQGSPLGS